MEAVGLAVGVVGLAGLFSTCLDIMDRFDSFKEFGPESRSVKAQFTAQKLRLQFWGHAVGFQGGVLMEKHSELLEDQEIHSACSDLLYAAIEDIYSYNDDSKAPLASALDQRQSLSKRIWPRKGRDGQESKLESFNWAARDKMKKLNQLRRLCDLVDALHNLVPTDGRGYIFQSKSGEAGQGIISSDSLNPGRWMIVFEQIMRGIEKDYEDGIKRYLHTWLLGPGSQNELYEISAAKRTPGTCEWALQQDWFLDWSSSEFLGKRAKILWINGPAGFGKSVLCARITEHLLKDSKAPVAQFFYSSDFESGRNPFSAIRSWISQIMSDAKVFALTRDRESGSQGRNPTSRDLENLLRDIATSIPGCTFIIDGLDECSSVDDGYKRDDGHSITNFLERLKSTVAGTQTRILIVSRDEPEIRNTLCNDEDKACRIYRYNLTPDDVRPDTEIYSRSIVNYKLPNRSDEIKEDIALKLAVRCNGQFLWVKLQEGYLRKTKSNTRIEQDINSTPTGLEYAYERNWKRISQLAEADRARTVSILRWAAFALRPLTVNEITGALLVSDDCKEVRVDDLPDSIDEDYISLEILDLCGSLIEVRNPQAESDVGLRTVHLTHFSVKEYLLSIFQSHGRILQPCSSLSLSTELVQNTLLANICLSYVDHDGVWIDNLDEQKKVNVLHAFRNYAVSAWHLHLRLGNMKDEQFINLAKHLFRAENPNWMPWKAQIDEHAKLNVAKALKELRISENLSTDSDFLGDHANGPSTKPTESSTEVERLFGKSTDCPLWYAASFGLSSIMDSLITTNKDRINEQGSLKLTALAGACANGNLETIQILLDNHALLNMPDTDGLSPLHSASRVGHNDVVKLLLTKGAKIEARAERMTPLHFAVLGGHLKTAQLLLDYNAEVEPQDSGGFTVIQGAVEFGHTELVKMLITRGANITTATNLELFQTACRKGFVEIVQILFDLGVDVNVSVSENHWTPLIWASRYGHVEAVKFLIEKGANLEARGKDMVTPLYCAVTNGHIKAAQLLLDHNPDVDARNIYDWTPLHSAVKEGYTELVSILITKGANIATANENGVGPFYTACHEGFIEIARLLLDVGVDVNIPTQEDQSTPLIAASECGHVEIAKFLLENGANVEARNNEMMTPFYCAAVNGHVKIIQLLFDHNADMDARQINNSTPVHAGVESGHIEVVKMLIAKGVNVNTANNSGIVPFYTACLEGFIEIARLLFDLGMDINVSTHEDQWAPLNAASRRGHAEIVKFLLENGAEIDFPNKYQETPLNLATFGGHLEVIKILVERGADVTKLDIWGWSLLNTAAEYGHLEVVNMLLDDGADIESTNEDGMTPLHSACANGFTEIVKVLIEKDANYTAANNKGCTPIMTACSKGHVDVVKFLLDKGANFNLQGHDGSTPINSACHSGHLEVVKLLLRHGADFNVVNEYGVSPLSNASLGGSTEIVRLLLEEGANVNSMNGVNKTKQAPLISACINGYLEVIKLLIRHGADIDIISFENLPPLYYASQNGFTEIVRLLLEEGANVNSLNEFKHAPLIIACAQGHLEVVKLLIRHGADLDFISFENVPPLYYASQNGFTEIVRLLLEEGANFNSLNEFKHAPLIIACAQGHLESVKLLIRYGADSNGVGATSQEVSALYCASVRGFTQIVRLLLGENDDVDNPDKTERDPLHVAIEISAEPKRTPIEKIDDVNPTNENAWAPLRTVVEVGSTQSINSTLNYATPDLEVLDNCGRTPLFMSAIRGHTDIVKLLHAKGAAVNISDKYGATPLWGAVKNGHREIVEYLLLIPGTLHALEYDAWDRSLLWWAHGCGSDDTLKLVRGVVEPTENSGPDTQERCKVAKYTVNFLRWCSACTRCLLDDEPYQHCNQCDDFGVCLQCDDFGVQCDDSAHVWERKVPAPEPEDSKAEGLTKS